MRTKLANDTVLLRKILLQHVVPGNVFSNGLFDNQILRSIEGTPLRIKLGPGGITVNGSRFLKVDIPASNGVIHVINDVVLHDIVSL